MGKSSHPVSSASTTTTSFIGFGAFANHDTTTTPIATSNSTISNDNPIGSVAAQQQQQHSWTPLYIGSDPTFTNLYTRINQKRDTTTIAKALMELQSYIHEIGDSGGGGGGSNNKKVLIDAMKHYAYLYYHRLAIGTFMTAAPTSFSTSGSSSSSSKKTKNQAQQQQSSPSSSVVATTDDTSLPTSTPTKRLSLSSSVTTTTILISSSTIRASSVQIWFSYYQYIPKAIHHILQQYPMLYGMIYTTLYDPSNEVRTVTLSKLQWSSSSELQQQQQQQLLIHPLLLRQHRKNPRSTPPLPPPTTTTTKDDYDDVAATTTTTKQQRQRELVEDPLIDQWNRGIVMYITQLLSYSKPIQYYEALCNNHYYYQNINKNNKKDNAIADAGIKSATTTSSIVLTEIQRDMIDELYIRMISTGLDSIISWLQLLYATSKNNQGIRHDSNIVVTLEDHVVIWFKPFVSFAAVTTSSSSSSSKSNHQHPPSTHALRRKTYQLLATIIMQAPDLLTDDSTSNSTTKFIEKIVLLALSNEKDPMNISSLLEMILSVLAYYKSNKVNKNHNHTDIDHNVQSSLIQVIYKPLIKLFQKGCYGAKVENQWGPMILPLLVGPNNNHNKNVFQLQQQYQLLLAIQNGGLSSSSSFTFGRNDKFHIYIALCETSNYILLQQQQEGRSVPTTTTTTPSSIDLDIELIQKIATIWIDGLHYFLLHSMATPNHVPRRLHTSTSTTTHSISSLSPITNISEGQTHFLYQLTNQLIQFHQITTRNGNDVANVSRRSCLFDHVKDWFWSDVITKLLNIDTIALTRPNTRNQSGTIPDTSYPLQSITQLLQELESRKHNEKSNPAPIVLTKLIPTTIGVFHRMLNELQTSSSAVPTDDIYQFFQIVLTYYGPIIVFDESILADMQRSETTTSGTSLGQFIMNDLLRWSVIHTSTCVTEPRHERSTYLVQQDFRLLSICLNGTETKSPSSNIGTKKDIWKSFIREIIVAKCDLQYFIDGLLTLIQHQLTEQRQPIDSVQDWLPCEVFDSFAVEIGHIRELELNLNEQNPEDGSDGTDKEEAKTTVFVSDTLRFFRICLGISSELNCDSRLVSDVVLTKWVDEVYGCSQSSRLSATTKSFSKKSLIIALLEVVEKKSSILNTLMITQILISSWHSLHHPMIESKTINILSSDVTVKKSFQATALHELRDDVDRYISNNVTDDSLTSWTKRVWFISKYCTDENMLESIPSLGFEITQRWFEHPNTMYRLGSSLLHGIPDAVDRLRLVQSWATGNVTEYIIDLLVAISEAHSNYFMATKCRDRKDRSAKFLYLIGGKIIDPNTIQNLIQVAIDKAAIVLQRGVEDEASQRSVAILSLLLNLKYESISDNFVEGLKPEEIAVGDILWYVIDSNNPTIREKVQVAQVHFDSTTGFYFSVILDRDGVSYEKQTVVERLRSVQYSEESGHEKLINSISDSEWADRKKTRHHIWTTVVVPSLTRGITPSLGELVNIIVSQLGLGEERGIGSTYYDILKFVNTIEQNIDNAIQYEAIEKVTDLLLALSYALGYGLNTVGSNYVMMYMWTDQLKFTTRLVSYFIEKGGEGSFSLNKAVITYLSVACSILGSSKFSKIENERFVFLLFSTSSAVIEASNDDELQISAILSYKALAACIMNSAKLEFPVQSTCHEMFINALHSSIKAFSYSTETKDISQDLFLPLQQFIVGCVGQQKLRDILSTICIRNSSSLCQCLFNPNQRSIAFMLLELVAVRGQALYESEDDVVFAPETALSLKEWTTGLEEGDAAVLEEDVYIVAEWVPSTLMVEIESWDDAGFEMDNQSTIIGRLLCWFCFLRFIESAAPKNFRNRPAFISYLGKCGAASSILNLGLLHNEIINDSKGKRTPTLDDVTDILQNIHPDITQLATLSLFRTVEVLPSLCRRWWEDDCPQVYSGAVQAIVEKFVAPEILRRELDRIKSATSFGKMTVSSSAISREVQAIYIQDDFSLMVVITLPAAFPFRSAEVDCSKTLGVPQSRWKRWSLQITQMLNSQGGTLQDALLLWKDNVDKEFEGVEPCPVCYSVLHVKTHKLPSLECKTCHNRFHMECLSEWFRSSGKSQCVLCQQPWQGMRV